MRVVVDIIKRDTTKDSMEFELSTLLSFAGRMLPVLLADGAKIMIRKAEA